MEKNERRQAYEHNRGNCSYNFNSYIRLDNGNSYQEVKVKEFMMKRRIMMVISVLTLTSLITIGTHASEKKGVEYKNEHDTFISDELKKACMEIGEEQNISPYLLMAIIETESSGNLYAINGECYGVCQINSKVWKCEDYYDYYENIEMCCRILKQYSTETCGDMAHVLSRYNGLSKANELCEKGEISKYANKVLTRAEEISEANEKEVTVWDTEQKN